MPEIRKHGFGSYWTIAVLTEQVAERFRRAVRRWQARRTAAALESLDDDVLRDIGITRAEIPAVALRITAPAGPTAKVRPAASAMPGKEVAI